jgi:hypothetical protein
MHSRSSSDSLLALLERHAGKPFERREEMKTILDLAARHNRVEDLDRLSFLAKFIVRTHGIMRRIGREGEGYDRLSAEFGLNLESARALLMDFLRQAPEPVRTVIAERYCAMTPAALDEALVLFRDLARFKNWRIDNPNEQAWKERLP